MFCGRHGQTDRIVIISSTFSQKMNARDDETGLRLFLISMMQFQVGGFDQSLDLVGEDAWHMRAFTD
jgi:hypothetical protein